MLQLCYTRQPGHRGLRRLRRLHEPGLHRLHESRVQVQNEDFGAAQIRWFTSSNDIHDSKRYTCLNGVHSHAHAIGVHFHAHANGVHAHANGVHVHAHANGVHVHAHANAVCDHFHAHANDVHARVLLLASQIVFLSCSCKWCTRPDPSG